MVYCVLVCIACLSLWKALQIEAGDLDLEGAAFDIDILDPFFTDPFSNLLSLKSSNSKLFLKFLYNIILAPLTVAKTSSRIISPSSFWTIFTSLTIFLFMFVFLHILQLAVDG